MPKNCSNDLNLVVNYIDRVLTFGTGMERNALKSMFGLQGLHDKDFAA